MKKALNIGFFLLLLVLFLWAGAAGMDKAHLRKARWDPTEGAAAGDTWINNYLPARETLLAPCRIWSRVIDRRRFPEIKAYLAPNGQFLFGTDGPAIIFPTEGVGRVASYCDAHGIDFLYVIFPGKPGADEELTKLGISCYRNRNADKMAEALAQMEIPVLDLRDSFRGKAYYSWFYKTEHHWTADAGLKAARELAARLNGEFGTGLDVGRLAEEKIAREVYPGVFIGEQGMKALGKYGERDDFIVRSPLYEPRLRYLCKEEKVDVSGGFDILVNGKTLAEDHLSGGRSLYYYYLFGNNGLVEIWDDDVPSGDLFLIKDSFSNVVTPFLALTARHITTWDMRKSNEVFAYLDAHPEIETVIIAYSLSYVPSSIMNDYR